MTIATGTDEFWYVVLVSIAAEVSVSVFAVGKRIATEMALEIARPDQVRHGRTNAFVGLEVAKPGVVSESSI